MTLAKSIKGDKAVVSLEGHLDTMTSPEAQEKILAVFEECPNVVLDFEKLKYISSTGLRVVLASQKRAVAVKGSLRLINVSTRIMEVFTMTGLDKVLTFGE